MAAATTLFSEAFAEAVRRAGDQWIRMTTKERATAIYSVMREVGKQLEGEVTSGNVPAPPL